MDSVFTVHTLVTIPALAQSGLNVRHSVRENIVGQIRIFKARVKMKKDKSSEVLQVRLPEGSMTKGNMPDTVPYHTTVYDLHDTSRERLAAQTMKNE